MCSFFVKCDKNPAMVRKEVLTKALHKICSDVFNDEIFANKPAGLLYVDRQIFCTLQVTGETSAKCNWVPSVCQKYKFEFKSVEEQFNALLLNQGGTSS